MRSDNSIAGIEQEIQALVDLETLGWNTKNPDLLLSIIHPDMVWPWPPTPDMHDPEDWVLELGRFDRERWRASWQKLFDSHDLVCNNRRTVTIRSSAEGDAAFAVVDIDTVWRNRSSGAEMAWRGRVCKIFTKMPGAGWKLISHTGALRYPVKE
jgi:hypothetical protein